MDILKILDKLNIESLNDMQNEASHAILDSNNDVVILSPTGSGKTLAYLLPLIQLIDKDNDCVQAVVIVPGRELALQSSKILENMSCGIRGMSLYGGRPTMDEHKVIKQVKPQIVFCTPGRLNDHIGKGNINVEDIKWFIIDEFDKCLEMGFHLQMKQLSESIPNINRHILLSATDSNIIPQYVKLGRTIHINYNSPDVQVPERIKIFQVQSPEKDKLQTLSRLLCCFKSQSSIVFLNYRESVERIDEYLRGYGFITSPYHGGMDQKKREDCLYKFMNGSSNVLICTDLASRGLDIKDVNNIIHYHLPANEDTYIHRVGRTARWEATGNSYFLIGPDEVFPEYIETKPIIFQIPEELPKPSLPKMATIYIGKGKANKLSKSDVVGFLCKKTGLNKDDIGNIDVKERYIYAAIKLSKLKQVLMLSKGEKIKGVKTIIEAVE
jgi:ATP-independent RNA helicase DbpA